MSWVDLRRTLALFPLTPYACVPYIFFFWLLLFYYHYFFKHPAIAGHEPGTSHSPLHPFTSQASLACFILFYSTLLLFYFICGGVVMICSKEYTRQTRYVENNNSSVIQRFNTSKVYVA